MEFKITTNHKGSRCKPWIESYNKTEVNNQAEAEAWGRATIERFNDTLRPGEQARVFISAEITGQGSREHDWRKQNSVTVMPKSMMGIPYDVMKCAQCGITGRRPGIGERIVHDKKFEHPKFNVCDLRNVSTSIRKK